MVFDWGYFKIYETTDLIGYLRGIYIWGAMVSRFLGVLFLLSSWGMFIRTSFVRLNFNVWPGWVIIIIQYDIIICNNHSNNISNNNITHPQRFNSKKMFLSSKKRFFTDLSCRYTGTLQIIATLNGTDEKFGWIWGCQIQKRLKNIGPTNDRET